MTTIIFWIFVLFTVVSAFKVVHSHNLIYAALSLLLTLFGVTALYVFLWADFLAGVQIVVYIGGILILLLFGIMLTHKITSIQITQLNMQRGVAGASALGILIILLWMIFRTPWFTMTSSEPLGTVREIGILLMSDYLLPFEVASVLLLAALIGAAMLSRKTE
ncbi:MAG: NADH-quinone oxidoreductase subunit J [Candidatus Neomarinimicrobiota bacterium]